MNKILTTLICSLLFIQPVFASNIIPHDCDNYLTDSMVKVLKEDLKEQKDPDLTLKSQALDALKTKNSYTIVNDDFVSIKKYAKAICDYLGLPAENGLTETLEQALSTVESSSFSKTQLISISSIIRNYTKTPETLHICELVEILQNYIFNTSIQGSTQDIKVDGYGCYKDVYFKNDESIFKINKDTMSIVNLENSKPKILSLLEKNMSYEAFQEDVDLTDEEITIIIYDLLVNKTTVRLNEFKCTLRKDEVIFENLDTFDISTIQLPITLLDCYKTLSFNDKPLKLNEIKNEGISREELVEKVEELQSITTQNVSQSKRKVSTKTVVCAIGFVLLSGLYVLWEKHKNKDKKQDDNDYDYYDSDDDYYDDDDDYYDGNDNKWD